MAYPSRSGACTASGIGGQDSLRVCEEPVTAEWLRVQDVAD